LSIAAARCGIGLAMLLSLGSSALAQGTPDPLARISLDSLLNVTVSAAARTAQTMSAAPASVTIITAEDIARHGYRTLSDVLQRVRGFYVTNDRNYTYVGVRGFGRPGDYNDRVLLMVNGHMVNENVYGSGPVGNDFALGLAAVERIVIVRGPASALYGTGAMFAVIDVVTRDPASAGSPWIAAELGTNGQREGLFRTGVPLPGNAGLMFSARVGETDGEDIYLREFDTPDTNNGIAEGLDWERYRSAFGSLRAGGLRVDAFVSAQRKGIPTASFGTTFNARGTESADAYRFIDARFEHALSATLRVQTHGYFDHYSYSGRYPSDEISVDSTDGKRAGAETSLVWDPRPNHRITMGAAVENNFRADYRSWYGSEEVFRGDFPFRRASLFVHDEFHVLPQLSLIAGVRWDGQKNEPSYATPRGAVVYRPLENTTLKLLYGEAFRTPNIYERYYEEREFFKSNPLLAREQIRVTELIWEQRLGGVFWGVLSAYRYNMRDLVDVSLDTSDSLYTFENRARARARGFEAELDARLGASASAYGSWTYEDARDEMDARMTNSPRHIGRVGLAIPVVEWALIAPEMRYESGRITVAGSHTRNLVVGRLNVSLGLTDELRASLLVDNLFDRSYTLPAGFEHEMSELPQPGRGVRLRVEYHF
jgi:iron complex outermembrane receptor protein